MKIAPSLGHLSFPYFAHEASCVMLDIDWTPRDLLTPKT